MSRCPQCNAEMVETTDWWDCCSYACLHDHRAAYEPQIAAEASEQGEFVREMPVVVGNPFNRYRGAI